jgi:hypothetical protein
MSMDVLGIYGHVIVQFKEVNLVVLYMLESMDVLGIK